MRKIALLICLTFTLCMAVGAFAQDGTEQQPQNAIPNYTIQPEDSNGRAVKLDQEKESGEELSAVEQRVIRRDTIRSNPTVVSPK